MKKVEKIIIASGNPAKVERYGEILARFASQVISLQETGVTEKPEENGNTAEENAEIKAKFYANKAKSLVFTEDEALYVDFLPENKQPGVHVRRIEGNEEASDEELFSYWEKVITDVPEEKRTGRWHIAYCIANPDGVIKTVASDHPIVFFSPSSKVRIPGWPMSSLEGPADYTKPHSELTDEERKQHEQESNARIVEKLRILMKGIKQ